MTHNPLPRRHSLQPLFVTPKQIHTLGDKKGIMYIDGSIIKCDGPINAMLAITIYEDNSKLLLPLVYKWHGQMYTPRTYINLESTLCLYNHWVRM